ncbi:hypothetical protein GGX14DRAFT_654160 [Mycena pura]|uniref:Uncharacterized protein n=1 Tax=Mycena pura TaxID=153505 RepID=A0AAD6V4K5_9AGAR|nr:hypothetical protein GGX14DRAFT_654160 [Mycena pura]
MFALDTSRNKRHVPLRNRHRRLPTYLPTYRLFRNVLLGGFSNERSRCNVAVVRPLASSSQHCPRGPQPAPQLSCRSSSCVSHAASGGTRLQTVKNLCAILRAAMSRRWPQAKYAADATLPFWGKLQWAARRLARRNDAQKTFVTANSEFKAQPSCLVSSVRLSPQPTIESPRVTPPSPAPKWPSPVSASPCPRRTRLHFAPDPVNLGEGSVSDIQSVVDEWLAGQRRYCVRGPSSSKNPSSANPKTNGGERVAALGAVASVVAPLATLLLAAW